MLITFGQLNTPIMEIREGGGGRGPGPAWRAGSARSPSHTLARWVLTGLSGSGAALQGYRRSFLSV